MLEWQVAGIIGIVILLLMLSASVALLFYFVMHIRAKRQHIALSEKILQQQLNILLLQNQKIADVEKLSWSGYRKFHINKKTHESETVCSFYFTPHDGKSLPPFKPGQYLVFKLQIPGQAKPVIRCYSLSDSCNHPDYYRVTIKRVPPPRDAPEAPPGLSSNFFHDGINEGDIIDVKSPQGHFTLDLPEEHPIVLIGGGIGVTPMLSIVNSESEVNSLREIWFFYCVHNGNDHIMKQHFIALAENNPNLHFHVVYGKPEETAQLGRDYHHAGHLSVDLLKEVLPSNNFDFYICGPPPMMKSVVAGLEEWQVPEKNIHFEAFGPATVVKTAEATHHEGAEESFEIKFARSGKSYPWTKQDGTLLEFAESKDIAIDFGCRAGGCGTCLVALRAGKVDYKIPPESPVEGGSCLTCIATPTSNIELDA